MLYRIQVVLAKTNQTCQQLFPKEEIQFMIKSYDFPKLFRPVVGQVIAKRTKSPEAITKTQRSQIYFLPKETMASERDEMRIKIKLAIKSKKKQLVHRTYLIKTEYSQEYNLGKFSENIPKRQKQIFTNFLKKKDTFRQTILSTVVDEIKPSQVNLSANLISMEGNMYSKTNKTRKKNQYRVRTSIQNATIPSSRQKGNRISNLFTYYQQKKKEKSKVNQENIPPSSRSVNRKRTFINTFESINQSDGTKKSIVKKKENVKKAVNFNVQPKNEEVQQQKIRQPMRRISRNNIIKPKFTIKKKQNKNQQISLSQISQSQYTSKSIVSNASLNKTNSCLQIKSQGSSDSNLNSLQLIRGSSKNKFTTKTCKFIGQDTFDDDKGYKSLSTFSKIQIPTINSIITNKSILRNTNKKSKTTNGKNKTNAKNLVNLVKNDKTSLGLCKRSQPYIISESTKAIQDSVMRVKTFQDLVYKKNLKSTLKIKNTNEINIFTQLNNFHNYLNENELFENDNEIQKCLSKPIIINSECRNRPVINYQMLLNENAMFDMGLTLIKKMNILKQKNL